VSALLERLRGGLIVSVQAYAESVLNTPEAIALLARCAVANGAVGLRIEGAARIAAVRAAVDVPIVGLVKRSHAGFEPYITSTPAEVEEAAVAGADIVAFDATERPRSGGASVAELTRAAHGLGRLAMADCALAAEARAAAGAGADIVATTLAGYTPQTRGLTLPALGLAAALAAIHEFAVCEGGIASPADARAAFAAGAAAVVVGTAITNVDELVRRFAAAAPRRAST
jgi:putative N-acetylmannosamine-6-phosphate epimerase